MKPNNPFKKESALNSQTLYRLPKNNQAKLTRSVILSDSERSQITKKYLINISAADTIMATEDNTLESLLELDGIKFIVDEQLGLWVKFEVKRIKQSKERPFGIKYSISLHNRWNDRILGFDNAHAIEYKKNIEKQTYDHCHINSFNEIRPYYYENAAKLLQDFWREVDRIFQTQREEVYVEA